MSAILGALIGVIATILYYNHVTSTQEKTIILLFVEENIIILRRCTMYYEQMLEGIVSLSTLFEVSDPATFTKLSEVVRDTSILSTTMKLKSSFFQVIKWADRSLILDPKSQRHIVDANAKARAMAFFLGSIHKEDDSYGRDNYKEYVSDIRSLLDYLEKLNSQKGISSFLSLLFATFRAQKRSLAKLINERLSELEALESKLEYLRLKEQKALLTEGVSFQPLSTASKPYV